MCIYNRYPNEEQTHSKLLQRGGVAATHSVTLPVIVIANAIALALLALYLVSPSFFHRQYISLTYIYSYIAGANSTIGCK
jgi:hypothetical protein